MMEQFQSIPTHLRAEPFVKWAGGKKRLLPAFDSLLPARFESYIEPFLGGGAMFIYLASIGRISSGVLSDVNGELIHLYRSVRDDAERLIAELETYTYDNDFYYALRSKDPHELSDIARAARMLYLNRTCFNGLYRVNRQGQFNVPIGRYESPVICNAPVLRNVSRLLQGMELQRWGFETTIELARPGDFIYLDPPSGSLVAVGEDDLEEVIFNSADDERLFDLYQALHKRGCKVLMSHKATPAVRQRYVRFEIRDLRIAGVKRERGRTGDIAIRNYF